jgi:uncharacterized protein YukE
MNSFTIWMAAILLLATPPVTMAQRGGRGTGSAGGTNSANGGNYPHDTDSDIKDFQKTFALQATDKQKSQFLSWNQNTEAVKHCLQELRSAVATNDFSTPFSALKAAVEKNASGYHDFLSSLTEAQHAGLKKPIQKLGKTNDELAKTLEAAMHELGQANSGASRTAKLAKAETAAENLLNEQKGIALDMSIGS